MQNRCDEKECDPSQQSAFPYRGQFDLSSLPLIQHFIHRFPPNFCEYNLANLFCWSHIYDYSWFSYKGRLLIYDGKNNILFMPMGCSLSPGELYSLAHDMMCMGLSPSICLASKAYIDDNPEIHHYFKVRKDRDSAEYIYRTNSLIELKGPKLHKKKNLIAQFQRRHPDYRIGPMDSNIRMAVQRFARDLLLAREPISKALEDEFSAMEKAFDLWDVLGLEGLVLSVQDNIAAFSVFSRLNPETFNVHFEKSNIAYKGAAQVINQETAIFLEDRAVFINREQDLGIAGLRQAKLSYEPHRLLVPHILSLKANA